MLADAWDGRPSARERMGAALAHPGVSNPIVLSGDVHSAWASNVPADPADPASAVLAAEFVTSSITSGGDGTDDPRMTATLLSENPNTKFFNKQRGYVRCHVTDQRWQTDYRVVPYVSRKGAEISTRASFVVEDVARGLA